MVVHDIMDGARLSTFGESDNNLFTYENTLRGTDAIDLIVMDYPNIHVVYVSGSSYAQLNTQYHKHSERFKHPEVVILYFDKYNLWERESGFVINTHVQFLRAMYSGNVTRGDYDPIDMARVLIGIGKGMKAYRLPGIIELRPKVAEIIENYIGARLAQNA